jgi:uncharacterized RDD family membrane protein YckC
VAVVPPPDRQRAIDLGRRVTVTDASASPRYAGLATRTLAFAVDVLLVNAAAWLVGAVVAVGLSVFNLPDEIVTVLAAVGAVLALAWLIGYFVFFWSSTGQTPGDRLLGITVFDAATLRPLNVRRALLRLLALPLSAIPLCAGFLLILFDRHRRALHDRLVHTVVVYAPVRARTPRPLPEPRTVTHA